MSEIKYVTGKTVEAAMASASAQYGNEKDVSYKIIEMPKKGFLGIGATPAKIEVTYEPEDAAAIFADVVSDIKKMKISTSKGSDGETNKDKKSEKIIKEEKLSPKEHKDNGKKNQKKKESNKENVVKQEPVKTSSETKAANKDQEKEPVVVTPEEMACAIDFANTLLKDMKLNAKVEQTSENSISIVGDNTNMLIGYHGETLDAIQYLINLCVCRHSETSQKEFVKITVDVENYREKRAQTLRSLARKTAEKAIKYKRNIVLEPMNPYERRIIHSEIQDMENVSTHSVGSDENRKIVVTYEGPDKAERNYHKHNKKRRKETNNQVESNENKD